MPTPSTTSTAMAVALDEKISVVESTKKMFRNASDLELSSYVQKAPTQIADRKERLLQASILDNCLTDFLDKSMHHGFHQVPKDSVRRAY